MTIVWKKERIFVTPRHHPFASRWSPFQSGRLICTAASNFGLVGASALYMPPATLDTVPSPEAAFLTPLHPAPAKEAIFDLAWSEQDPQLFVTAAGDGSVTLWQQQQQQEQGAGPVAPLTRPMRMHQREVSCVHWDPLKKDSFLSGSWDGTIKQIKGGESVIGSWSHSSAVIHKVKWSPHEPGLFVSCSADGTVSARSTNSHSGSNPLFSFLAHPHEIMALDWLKYANRQIVTGGADGSLRIWDLRFIKTSPLHHHHPSSNNNNNNSTPLPLATLKGHAYAVRSVACSPHSPDHLISTSYDMTWRLWNLKTGIGLVMEELTEFVVDVDFDLFTPGRVSLCCWDETVRIFDLAF